MDPWTALDETYLFAERERYQPPHTTPRSTATMPKKSTTVPKSKPRAKVQLAEKKKKVDAAPEKAVAKKKSAAKKTKAAPKKVSLTSRRKNPVGVAKTEMAIKKPHRFRPGTVALREVRKEQKSTS
jgi:hypothetical protein